MCIRDRFSGTLHAQLEVWRVVRVSLEVGAVRARLLKMILHS